MLPVEKISALADENLNSEAHAALDEILALGPNNFAALKLRARLFRDSGRFLEESKIWQKIAVIDTSDEDYERFLTSRKKDEREYIFFTQDIPTEGRRFLTMSKSVLYSAIFGLMGSIVFLSYSHVAQVYTEFLKLSYLLGCFTLFVVTPWVWIIRCFLFSLRSVTVCDQRIIFRSFLKTHELKKEHLQSVTVQLDAKGQLFLSFLSNEFPSIGIDFREDYSPIRSRSFFLRDLQKQKFPVSFVAESSRSKFLGVRFF